MSIRSDMDKAFGQVSAEVQAELAQNGQLIDASKLIALVLPRLFDRWLDAGKYDEIIDFFVVQGNGGTIDKVVRLSNKLVKADDKPRLVRLWRAMIGKEKLSTSQQPALRAMEEFIQALEQIGDSKLASRVRQESELFAKGEQRKLSKPDTRAITEPLFWDIVLQAKTQAGSPTDRPWLLEEFLEAFSARSIKQFAQMFWEKMAQAYNYDLWAIAYIANGGCSDDGFEYFRAWLISEGRGPFEAALQDPQSIADLQQEPLLLEGMLYAATEAYERRANKLLKIKPLQPKQPSGKPWQETDLPVRFPQACQKFGWTDGSS